MRDGWLRSSVCPDAPANSAAKGTPLSPRYHNHLDAAIVSAAWTPEEEHALYQLHDELGNKWSAIALRLAGR